MAARTITSSSGVRPCIGVNEMKILAEKNETNGYYYLSKSFTPPDTITVYGLEEGKMYDETVTDTQPDREYLLLWNEAQGDIDRYFVIGNCTDGSSFFEDTGTDTQVIVKSPSKGYSTYTYLLYAYEVGQTSGKPCATATISTRNSNIHCYGDDGLWYLANPKHYNGTSWNDNPNAMYYYGEDTSHLLYGSGSTTTASWYVENLTDVGFEDVGNDWWESQNHDNNTTAKCRIVINALAGTRVTVQCVNSSEQYTNGCFDYGRLSYLNSESILKTFQNDTSRDVVTVDYGTISTAGTYYIYAEYIKDVSAQGGDDSFKFTVILT